MANFDRVTEKVCGCCGNIRPKGSFYQSLKNKEEYLPICKECMRKHYNLAYDKTKSYSVALWSICMEVGVPLIKEAYEVAYSQYEESEKAGEKPNLFKYYYTMLKSLGIVYSGNFDSDMSISDFINLSSNKKGNQVADDTEDVEVRANWDRTWGKNYNNYQCRLLDEYFNNYTQEIVEMDTAMTLRYRDLCKAELRKFEGNDDKEVTDEILRLMKLLKIDNFADTKQSEISMFIERKAWEIENTKPAECEDLEKYKDFSGFEKTWEHIMRCVRNLIAGTKDYPKIPKGEE